MTSTALLHAFVRQLAALDDAAWRRIAGRVPHLGDDSAQALLARGDAVAQGLPPAVPSFLRTLLGAAHALHSEFPAAGGRIPTPAQIAASRLSPAQQASALTSAALVTLLDARRTAFPGAVACAEAAVPSLIAPQFYSPEQRTALYAPFEPDIPFATLTAPPDPL
jgi:hypothetical protein